MKALERTARRTPLKLLLLRSEAAIDGSGIGGGSDAIEDHVHVREYAHRIKPQTCAIPVGGFSFWFVFLVLAVLVSWGRWGRPEKG